jgi:hypothetical protein
VQANGNLKAIPILLDERKIESTVRFLGVDVEDAMVLREAIDVQQHPTMPSIACDIL